MLESPQALFITFGHESSIIRGQIQSHKELEFWILFLFPKYCSLLLKADGSVRGKDRQMDSLPIGLSVAVQAGSDWPGAHLGSLA